ncbi:MAG: hypothetical protein ACSW8H_06985, partial [bacterium]
MKKALPLTVMLAAILLLTACNTQKDETGSAALVQSTEKAAAVKTAEGNPELMGYDFKQFKNVRELLMKASSPAKRYSLRLRCGLRISVTEMQQWTHRFSASESI